MTSNSNTVQDQASARPGIGSPVPPPVKPRRRCYLMRSLHQLRAGSWPTLKYLAETEVHTYAFSVAANAILSFVPAVVLMGTISRYILHSRPMYDLLLDLLKSYLPTWNYGAKSEVLKAVKGLVEQHHTIGIMSVVMLLISSTGVFEPLEVALNKVWGFRTNRNYLMNQVVSLGLALGCGVLALGSVALTTQMQPAATHYVLDLAKPEQRTLRASTAVANGTNRASPAVQKKPKRMQTRSVIFANRIKATRGWVKTATYWVVMKTFAMMTSVLIFFLIYWVLPNGKVKALDVLPAAIATGVSLEIAKYGFMGVLHFLDFQKDYGDMFYIPVTLIFWAFTAGMLMLGGAHLSAYGKTKETAQG